MRTFTLISATLFGAAFIPCSAIAQVYKCKEGGTTVFSATPCAPNAQAINVTPASGASRAPSRADSERDARKDVQVESGGQPAPRTMVQRADDSARRRILDDEIWRKQRELDALQDELSHRQSMLRAQKSRANNNLAGAVWAQSISEEMQAMSTEYDIKMRRIAKEIDDLKAKRAQIPN